LAIEGALQNEKGEFLAIVHDSGNMMRNLLERALPNEPFFAQIDWYGDTVFNRMQMPRFLSAWQTLAQQVRDDQEKKLIEDIKALAQRCEDGVHLYLRFIGD
jgi:hypothetical protein